MSEKRIVFVIGSMREGGAEKQLLYLVEGLHARDWAVSVMLLHAEGVRLERLRDSGARVFEVRLPRFRPWWSPVPWIRLVPCWFRSRTFLKKSRPAILHAWLFWAHLWAWLISWRMSVPLLTSRRQTRSDKRGRWLLEMLENTINSRTRIVTANSEAVRSAALVQERNLPEVRVIMNGIDLTSIDSISPADLAQFFPAGRTPRHIAVFVGNQLPYKGHLDLLGALALLRTRGIDVGVVCVGAESPHSQAIRQRVEELGLGDRVVLTGPRTDVIALIKGADFAVHPSLDEGMSNAVMEYLACGRFVVATDVGGNRELLDKESGVIVPAGDAAALADAMAAVAEGLDRSEHVAAASPVIARLSVERMVEQYEKLYEEILG